MFAGTSVRAPGKFTREQAAREGRDLLIADVNSACVAALTTGADEVIVRDTHHGGGNIEQQCGVVKWINGARSRHADSARVIETTTNGDIAGERNGGRDHACALRGDRNDDPRSLA